MAEKCAACGNTIETIFLEKIRGMYRKEKGRKIAICSDCQRKQA